jgi:hypothetical protein
MALGRSVPNGSIRIRDRIDPTLPRNFILKKRARVGLAFTFPSIQIPPITRNKDESRKIGPKWVHSSTGLYQPYLPREGHKKWA